MRTTTTLTLLITTLLLHSLTTAAAPTTRQCTNHLLNPSFETGLTMPWLTILESAFSTRGVVTTPNAHSGTHTFYAHATSTIESTLTISQSYIPAPVGKVVECYSWVRGRRGIGETRVDVFLDGVACGNAILESGEEGWRRVGGSVNVAGGMPGMGSTVAVVLSTMMAGVGGWEVWIDDVGVVEC